MNRMVRADFPLPPAPRITTFTPSPHAASQAFGQIRRLSVYFPDQTRVSWGAVPAVRAVQLGAEFCPNFL